MNTTAVSPAIKGVLESLACGRDLSMMEAAQVLREIMEGEVGPVQAAAFLMGLRAKGETAQEIVGLAETMRSLAETVEVGGQFPLVDVVGTGGDGLGTFNISTTAAFVAAGAGACVAKHGNRGASSRSGAADVLEALGVSIDLPPRSVAQCIREVGIGFMFAPLHHTAMRHVVTVRKELGIRTVFNFLGPLTNPAGARRQLTGVSVPEYVPVLAEAQAAMGCDHALVAHGEEGMDELSVAGRSLVMEVREGRAGSLFHLEPEMFGLSRHPVQSLSGGEPERNAEITESVLGGRSGAPRDVVLLNAGAALYVSGCAASIQEGVDAAAESIEEGRAAEKLAALRDCTRRLAGDLSEGRGVSP